jgi:anthranilate synthase component 1
MVRTFEPTVPAPPPDELGLPDMVYMISDTLVIFDHRYRRMHLVAYAYTEGRELSEAYDEAVQKIERMAEELQGDAPLEPINLLRKSDPIEIRSNTTPEEYMDMVRASKEYVKAGDIFQVVGSQRFETDFPDGALDLYRHLRYINPSPYMFCLHFPERFSLVGSSPELHVRCIDGHVNIRPIAGTRHRGKDTQEDERLKQDLLDDPKECAEHIMLVDLARNDLGRISKFGSVKVDELMIVELYSHVMHIVSNVNGELREDCDAYDVLRATFPAGTVSGSPKVRAMQIINELEKSKRCAYSGAVGYFGFDGNHDSCITLRSVVLKDGKAYVQAGAGLVADSVPENEHQECVNKAMALMKAIEACRGRN